MSTRFRKTGTSSVTDHNQLLNKGTRTHTEIDAHLAEIDAARDTAVDLAERMRLIGQKIVVFVIPDAAPGPYPVEIKFPFKGTVIGVSASCSIAAVSGITDIQVERCSQADYQTTAGWSGLLSTRLTIQATEQTDNPSTPAVINPASSATSANDYFRVNFVDVGAGVEGLVVEVQITI